MSNKEIKKGDLLLCLTTTPVPGYSRKCFYLYETALSWDYIDGKGQVKPGVVKSYEPWDGVSFIITDNGD